MFEFEEFKKEVIGTYRSMLLHHELDTRLEHPTPGNLRNLSLKLYANGLSKEDIQVFQDFFNPTNKYADLETGIRRFELDKLKPLKNFIMAKTSNPDENIVKLLAILIQFSPRPFHKWRQLRHQKKTILPQQPEHIKDKHIKIQEKYERIECQRMDEGGRIGTNNCLDENQDLQQHSAVKQIKERPDIKSKEKSIPDSLNGNSDYKNQQVRRHLTNRNTTEKDLAEIKKGNVKLDNKWIGIREQAPTKKEGLHENQISGLHQKKMRSSSQIDIKEDRPFPQDSFSMIKPAVAAKEKNSDPINFNFEIKHLLYLLGFTFCMILFCITTYFITSKLRMCWIEVQYVTADYPSYVEQQEIVPINQAQFSYSKKITATHPTIATIPTNRISYPTSSESMATADSTALLPIAVQDSIKPTPHYVILLYADENHTEASIRKKFRSDPSPLLNK